MKPTHAAATVAAAVFLWAMLFAALWWLPTGSLQLVAVAALSITICAGLIYFGTSRLVVLLVVLAPALALAQDVVVDPGAASVLLPDLQAIGGAASAGRWALVVVLVLSLSLRIFYRVVLRRLPDSGFRRWCSSTTGGWVLNGSLSLLASLSAYLAAASTITPAGLISAVLGGGLLALGGAGANELAKDTGVFKPVASPTEAAAELALPPR